MDPYGPRLRTSNLDGKICHLRLKLVDYEHLVFLFLNFEITTNCINQMYSLFKGLAKQFNPKYTISELSEVRSSVEMLSLIILRDGFHVIMINKSHLT